MRADRMVPKGELNMKNQLAFMAFVGAIICAATCFAELNGYSKTGTVQPVSIKPLPLNRSQVQMTGKTLPAVSSRVVKEKVLSPIMEANAKEFTELKIRLGISDSELSRTDVLELITLAYAKLFDGLEVRVADLERRVQNLETESAALRTDTDALQKQAKAFDEDLDKIFKWSDKIDTELHNEFQVDGVLYKVSQLRKDVSTDLDNHAQAIDKNTRSVRELWGGVNQNSADIRNLSNTIRMLR